MTLKTQRLELLEAGHTWTTPVGRMRSVLVNAWGRHDRFPSCLVASLLLVEVGPRDGRWLLSHVLVEDEARRQGYASELVQFYEERLGGLDACWASDAGSAFARAYVARHGPRPAWEIRPPGELGRLAAAMAEAAKGGAHG